MKRNKKNNKKYSNRSPEGSPPANLQPSRYSRIRSIKEEQHCIELLITHPAFLFGFQTGLKQLQMVLPSCFRFRFERNPLQMMPIFLSHLTRILLIHKMRLSTILVQRLLCVPGQVAGDHLRLGSCVLRRFFLQMCGKPPLTKFSLVRTGSIRSVTFHHSGRFMAIGTTDKAANAANTAHIFNVSSNGSSTSCVNPPLKRSHLSAVNSIAWHPSAPVIATVGDDNAFKAWLFSSGMNGSCISTHYSHTESVNSVKFNTDGSCIATGSDDKTAKLWRSNFDSTSWNCTATLNGHTGSIRSVEFHPTALCLATASGDNTVRLWRLSPDNSSATCVATLEGHTGPVNSVAFHPTAQVMATGSCDNTVKLWRLSADNSSAICVDTLRGHTGNVNAVAFHPSGHIIVTGSRDKTAKLWRLSANNSSATCVETLKGHSDSVNSVAFHPKASLLVTGSDDNTVRFWR
jgi:WD40 repeat protein